MEKYKVLQSNPAYMVSNLGNIKSVDRLSAYTKGDGKIHYRKRRGILLKQFNSGHKKNKSPKGYMKVGLEGGKKYYVHRLVAEAWCIRKPIHTQIDHLNQNTLDNRSCNLEWVTSTENHRRYKFTPKNKYLGISQKPNGRWGAWKKINGKSTYLGTADNEEDAHELYKAVL